jgi:hypothetical protein
MENLVHYDKSFFVSAAKVRISRQTASASPLRMSVFCNPVANEGVKKGKTLN